MLEKMIKPANAILATRYLMELDIGDVREYYQRDLYQWVAPLKQAQKDYLAYLSGDRETHNETMQMRLTKLAQCATNITSLLSDEAKHQLQDWLLMNEKL